MKNKELTISYQVLGRDELNEEELEDIQHATEDRREAYAPYSHFHVGAAIRTNAGIILTGHNVENVIYNAAHAEDGAISEMSKEDRKSGIKRITIVGALEGQESESPCLPCGQCRQKIIEHLRSEDVETAYLISAGTRGAVLKMLLKDMLPHAFLPSELIDDEDDDGG